MFRFSSRPRLSLSVVSSAVLALTLGACGDSRRPAVVERQAQACTDFYAWSNADWIAATPIPAEGLVTDATTGLAARNQTTVLARLQALAASGGVAGGDLHQAALITLFASRADSAAVELADLAPLAADLVLIDGITDMAAMPAAWGRLMRQGVRLPVALRVEPFDDVENADADQHQDRLRVAFDPTAPARAPSDDEPGHTPAEFQAHVARTLVLTGMPEEQAEQASAAVSAIEQALAGFPDQSRSRSSTGDAAFAVGELLSAAGVPAALPSVVDDSVASGLGELMAAFEVQDWRNFLRWRLVRSYTDYLPMRFADERATWDPPAPPDVVDENVIVDGNVAFLTRTLPFQFDWFSARQMLPAGTDTQVRDMVGHLRTALHRHLDSRSWMSAASKAASHRQVDTVDVSLPGFEDTAAAPPAMQRDRLLDNVRLASAYELDRRLAVAAASRTGRSLTGAAWWDPEARYNFVSHSVKVSPLMVQALLAGTGDDPGRFGALGVVMAHELLHMFGAPRDTALSPRQPVDWLDAADRPYFDGMVARLENDYAEWALQHFRAAVVKPRFMGEDLSDLGSVPVALAALHESAGGAVDGEAENVFYRAFAFSQRVRQSASEDRSWIEYVPAHALYPYRVNGPLSNLDGFRQRYGCVQGDDMVRSAEMRVNLW
ncbi:M13-type metalloendopeptidase [Xylophilus sp. GOD-11R]|uniref:M13-type metalloendopeptidase n=1 Tax=Xylophilus sp. GOD-11R TaxID=3089814 RepID=UPI00298C1383|nr:M13-type metalloendopeptidase [Xylophilus sp. GOD-11R]WPB55189.1 M13-type metalloendopeptidase [Xylophilus sp. GOD-11R]